MDDEEEEEEEKEEEEKEKAKASSSFSSFLNDPPALITHKRPVRKVFEVLQPLIDARVSSLAALRKEWARDASFLKRGIKMWVRPERAAEFEALWKKRQESK
jgi:TATA-binding protein-associated factor Taf7